jgi:fumarate hydratase class II
MNFRIETDTMGEVQVPADKYWGAQTERSRNNFRIGPEASMPREIIHAFAVLKKAAALANHELGVLPAEKRDLIARVCDEISAGQLDDQFPLVIWQTGSGTQSNMNANEVIAHRATEFHLASGEATLVIHPNDHVNRCQSSNDVFPTVMHLAAVHELHERLFPALDTPAGHLRGCPGRGAPAPAQDRPDPSAGRHAHHRGPGDQRLGGSSSAWPVMHWLRPCPACGNWPWAARRWAPG